MIIFTSPRARINIFYSILIRRKITRIRNSMFTSERKILPEKRYLYISLYLLQFNLYYREKQSFKIVLIIVSLFFPPIQLNNFTRIIETIREKYDDETNERNNESPFRDGERKAVGSTSAGQVFPTGVPPNQYVIYCLHFAYFRTAVIQCVSRG